MLRRPGQPDLVPSDAGDLPFPDADEPYQTGDHPPGVMFYIRRGCFFFPYALLHWIRFDEDKIIIRYSGATVDVSGRGLHALYTALATQTVVRVVEQGERYGEVSDAATFVRQVDVAFIHRMNTEESEE